MDEKKIKIALFIRGFHNGGIEKVFELYYSHMDLSPFEIHVITHRKNDPERERVFTDMGCVIHPLSKLHGHKLTKTNIREYQTLFRENRFDIVHNNMPENLLPLYFAKKYQIPTRILHAHNNYTAGYEKKNKLVASLFRMGFKLNTDKATALLAVSRIAAASAFGKKQDQAVILPNAIDLSKFAFDEEKRAVCRRQLGVREDEILFGHVGRYETDQKNQEFVLRVFRKVAALHDNCKLVMIGEGKRRGEFETMASQLGIDAKTTFTGNVENVADYLSAMDFYLFPSRKEGLGVAAVEAQASGLYCLLSDQVPKEAKVTENAQFLSIQAEDAEDLWVDCIEAHVCNAVTERKKAAEQVKRAGYDIAEQAQKLEEIYCGKIG